MARPVDEKIVRMTLDNAKFKDNVKDTLNSFKAIDDGLNKTGAVDLSGIAKAVDTIQSRFSAFGVIAATVINRITDAAIDMGKRVYSAMVDPIVEGGKKRALNIEQAKFQFEGLGMDVEKTMESANEAVLGTAYGLDEAAVIAAQFGASGMKAGEEMTQALRGISGVAAMTGGSYADIGRIFTQVAGQGRLMGDQLLQLSGRGINAAATLAKHLGITEAEVREMVTKGQIDFETFTEAMSEAFGEHATKANETFTGSLSNVRAALARIGAEFFTPNLKNARDVFNAITPVVNELKDALMPLIEAINELTTKAAKNLIKYLGDIDFSKFERLGVIENMVKSFWNVVGFGQTVMGAMSEGFRRVFPKSFMETLASISEGFARLTDGLNMSSDTADKITTVFQGIFSVFDSVWYIAKELGKTIINIIPEGTGGLILDFAVSVAEMAISFNEALKEGEALSSILSGIGSVFTWLGDLIRVPGRAIIDFANAIYDNFGGIVNWLKTSLAPVGQWFSDAFGHFGGEEILGAGFLVSIMTLIPKIKGFIDNLTKGFSGFTSSFKGIFDQLGDTLKAFQDKVRYDNLLKIAVAVGILAVSLKLLEGMSIADIAKGLGALVGSMAILSLGMMAIEKLNFTGGIRASVTILALSTSLLIMAGALKSLAGLDLKEVGVGLLGIAGVMVTLVGAMTIMSKISGKIAIGSIQMIALATSVVILANAVKTMSSIKASSLAKSVLALGAIFTTLAVFLKVVDRSGVGPGVAIGLLGTAAAIQIIVSAIGKIANFNVGELTKGLVVIGIILAEIAIFSKISGSPQILMAGAGIMIIAVALNAILVPIKAMSEMSWEELAKGLVGIAGALLALSVAGIAASSGIVGAAAILVMATAMTTLMIPIEAFSNMSWGEMLKGISGLAISMGVLAGASLLLSPAIVPMLGFSAALLAIGAAVAAVGAGVALFGMGLTALSTLTATSVAAIISALGLLITGLGSLIIDIVDFVVDLGSALIGGMKKLVPEIIEAGIEIVMALMRGLGDNAQEFVEAGYNIISAILIGINNKLPELYMIAFITAVNVINGLSDAIAANRTHFVNAVVRLMGEVILVVIEAGREMVVALFGWIPGVEAAAMEIGNTAEKYVRENFNAGEVGATKGIEFADGLESTSSDVESAGKRIAESGKDGSESVMLKDTGTNMGNGFTAGLLTTTGSANTAGRTVASNTRSGASSVSLTSTGNSLGNQFTSGVTNRSSQASNAGRSLATNSRSGASSISLNNAGRNVGNQFTSGINSRSSSARNTGRNIAISGRSGASSISMYSTGQNFSRGFANGISSMRRTVISKASSLAARAASAVAGRLGIRSPSRLLTSFGVFFGEGLGNGIASTVRTVSGKAKDLASKASAAVSENLSAILPDEEELKIKIDFDDPEFDFDPPEPQPIPFFPDVDFTQMMADMAFSGFRQNGDNSNNDSNVTNEENHEYHYNINVTAGGLSSRSEIRDLARKIDSEIKNLNDRTRISRGEEVAF